MELIAFAAGIILAHLVTGPALSRLRLPRYYALALLAFELLLGAVLLLPWRTFLVVWILANGLMLLLMTRLHQARPAP